MLILKEIFFLIFTLGWNLLLYHSHLLAIELLEWWEWVPVTGLGKWRQSSVLLHACSSPKARHICQLIIDPHFSEIAPQGRNTFTLRFALVSERLVIPSHIPPYRETVGQKARLRVNSSPQGSNTGKLFQGGAHSPSKECSQTHVIWFMQKCWPKWPEIQNCMSVSQPCSLSNWCYLFKHTVGPKPCQTNSDVGC